jgi:hypothetical protein
MTDRPFNPENVESLLRNLPDGSFAASLVRTAADETAGTPASRVADLLEKRVEEVRAQLHGAPDVA